MRVLVTGGRDFNDQVLLTETLDRFHSEYGFTVLIHGGARGADKLAGEWAQAKGIQVIACQADWKRFGRGAGVIRNSQLLAEKPELVIAFPGGKGTADMIKKAMAAGLNVIPVEVKRPS
jgi:predicted Rossmann-fold nucleotide-binding protein